LKRGSIEVNDHWIYVTAAYALTLLLGGGVLLHSWRQMRRAERAVDALKDDRP
jgi:heme exporter protein CcmD